MILFILILFVVAVKIFGSSAAIALFFESAKYWLFCIIISLLAVLLIAFAFYAFCKAYDYYKYRR